jgi:hypothetical protein
VFKLKSKRAVQLRLAGGLGNQLFQIFYALSIASEYRAQLIVNVAYMNDFSIFRLRSKYVGKRNLSINHLNLLNDSDFIINSSRTHFFNLCFGLFRIFKSKIFARIVMKVTGVYYLDGYFMDAQSFPITERILKKYIAHFQTHLVQTDSCMVHVRAGDLLNQPYNPKCSEKYYFLAFSYMNSVYGVKNFTIVSEDEAYSRLVLKNCSNYFNLVYLNAGSVAEDFMRLCSGKYLIAANSTFSWWAGVLGLSTKFVIPEFIYRAGDKPTVEKEFNIGHS